MKRVLLLIIFIFIVGCQNQIVCDEPYIQVGSDCCLDKDSNSICDKDESLVDNLSSSDNGKSEDIKEDCMNECESSSCDELYFIDCIEDEDGCMVKKEKDKVIGECGVDCLTEFDCDSKFRCNQHNCEQFPQDASFEVLGVLGNHYDIEYSSSSTICSVKYLVLDIDNKEGLLMDPILHLKLVMAPYSELFSSTIVDEDFTLYMNHSFGKGKHIAKVPFNIFRDNGVSGDVGYELIATLKSWEGEVLDEKVYDLEVDVGICKLPFNFNEDSDFGSNVEIEFEVEDISVSDNGEKIESISYVVKDVDDFKMVFFMENDCWDMDNINDDEFCEHKFRYSEEPEGELELNVLEGTSLRLYVVNNDLSYSRQTISFELDCDEEEVFIEKGSSVETKIVRSNCVVNKID